MNATRIITQFLVLLIGLNAYSQTFKFEIQNQWDVAKNSCLPCDYNEITGEVFSTHTLQIPVKGKYTFSYVIDAINFKSITLPNFYDKSVLPNKSSLEVAFGTSRNENFVTLAMNPLVNNGGTIEMVESVKITVTGSPNATASDRDAFFASTSVLSSGEWYKIGVSSDGIHKLDYNFLSTLGIDVASLNPNHLNVYGNHFAELPTRNNVYRPDDLLKNAISIVGEADGVFNETDYVLFYANGPDNVKNGFEDFDPRKNRIDSLSYYFIHIDASDTPKRIGVTANSTSPVTGSINRTTAYAFHEVNETNLLKSGDGWLGQKFDVELTKNISFNLENLDISVPIKMKTVYANAMKSGTASLKVNVNGIERDNIPATLSPGSYTVAKVGTSEVSFTSSTSNLSIEVVFERSTSATEAWLDYIQLNYTQRLQMGSNQLFIHDLRSVGAGNVISYTVANADGNTKVWEVTDPTNASSINGNLTGTNYNFIANADSLKTFVAFTDAQAKTPIGTGGYLGKIANQNLHGLSQVDYLIVTHESLKPQAERLANLHRNNGLTVHVVDVQSVYNEFGGGASDPVAIRWMAKMFYQRAPLDPENSLKSLCLFGDGTYDPLNRIEDNNYLIPTYNSVETGNIDYVSSFTADDFFGLLDDAEGIGPYDMLDIGVGRIPVTNLEEAESVVNKIEHYMNYGSSLYSNASGVQCDETGYASTFGDWRNRIVLMADDENGGQFIRDCEALSDTTEKYHPEMNVVKIYLDAYKQIVTSGGQRYPEVEEAINQNINNGALIFNYVGHGGETGLALERVVTIPMIKDWSNINNLTIFISATCEFSRFDDPGRVSAGETVLLTPYGGAVAMLTTTRLVYITINTLLVQNLYTILFKEEGGSPLSLGEILRRTKNATLGNNNMRNFSLLGDPALKLGKPKPSVVTDAINGETVITEMDTLKALSKITVKGHVENLSGDILMGYNGIVYPTVFDKRKIRNSLGQDVYSPVLPFDLQTNIIYKGKATVKNGEFEYSFVVPKDINYDYGKGKISYYSDNSSYDNYGFDTSFYVGGVDPNGITDDVGPTIELFLNDESFVNGGIADTKPLFLANVKDENGINTTGNGIGHNITLVLDDNTAEPIILNNFYEADLDTYQSGKVSYRLSELAEGPHKITFKVWDVNNNSSEATLDFTVINEQEIGISHLLNYPNPFTTNTDFYFEHNQVCNSLDVKIEIFTVSGKLVKSIFEVVNSSGFRSEGINWDGRDDYGDKLARGVYVYRLSIETDQGKKAEKLEKLVIL